MQKTEEGSEQLKNEFGLKISVDRVSAANRTRVQSLGKGRTERVSESESERERYVVNM